MLKYKFMGLSLSIFLLAGCGKIDYPPDRVYVRDATILEVSVLNGKHVTIRTVEGEVIVLKVTWEQMPPIKAGTVTDIGYLSGDKTLYDVTL